ncbi:hypothetical protein G7046_g9933 [Stylonectria norvegica]|nr:hypothetical protein G7046_g9933 [Stylonectria norvegica]
MSALQRSRSLRKPSTSAAPVDSAANKKADADPRHGSPSRLPVKPVTRSASIATRSLRSSGQPSLSNTGLARSASVRQPALANEPPKRETSRYPPSTTTTRPRPAPRPTASAPRPTSSDGPSSQTKHFSVAASTLAERLWTYDHNNDPPFTLPHLFYAREINHSVSSGAPTAPSIIHNATAALLACQIHSSQTPDLDVPGSPVPVQATSQRRRLSRNEQAADGAPPAAPAASRCGSRRRRVACQREEEARRTLLEACSGKPSRRRAGARRRRAEKRPGFEEMGC